MTGRSVEYETWTAKIAYIRKDISGNVQEKVEKKTVTIKLASTNCSTQTYRVVASYTSSEAVPTGVAAAVYASWSKLHWDGELLITEAEATFSALPKHKVNLTGGRTEWASMDSIVQESIIDIDSGQTTIKVGSSGRLEADSLVALYRAAHARRYSYSRLSRTNATISGSESTGSYNMPTSHLSEGDPGERMRLRVADTDGSRTHILDLDPSGITFGASADAAAKTLQLREIFVMSRADGKLYKVQALCSEPYGTGIVHPGNIGFLFTAGGSGLYFNGVGQVYLGGVVKTISGAPSAGIVSPTPATGTIYYLSLNYSTGACAWSSGSSVPAATDTTEYFRIATITVASDVITVYQHLVGDIHESLVP
jgi:hypothetical protein